jgi:hypothetical protein
MEDGGNECRGIRRRILVKEGSEDRKDVRHGKDNRREQAMFDRFRSLLFVYVGPAASDLLISPWNHEYDTFSPDIRIDAFLDISDGILAKMVARFSYIFVISTGLL